MSESSPGQRVTLRDVARAQAERDLAVRAAWNAGESGAAMARRFGVSDTCLRRWLRRLELPLSHAPMPPEAVAARTLWDEGYAVAEIAAKVGRTGQQVAEMARRWGFPARVVAAPVVAAPVVGMAAGLDGAQGKKREPLPPGHPASWGLISGEPWPHLLPWQRFAAVPGDGAPHV